jgi:hypothetical protein
VLLPSLESADFSFYDLHKSYSSDEMRLSQILWKEFDGKLSSSQRNRFSVTTTSLLLTHSIGIYDGPMYVNPFCIGLDSADLPSIRIEPYMPAYDAYARDALEHVLHGDRLCGNSPSSFLTGIV